MNLHMKKAPCGLGAFNKAEVSDGLSGAETSVADFYGSAHIQRPAILNSGSKKPLRPRFRDMLVTGEHPYASRSEAVYAITGEMVRCGWGWAEYYEAFTDPTNELSHWFTQRKTGRTRSDTWRHKQLDKTWEKVTSTSAPITDARSARQAIGLIRARLTEDGAWTGRTAVTDRIVLEWIHQEATRTGRIVLPVASRDLTLNLQIPQKTATRALKRLCDRRWLRVEEKADGTNATVYRLTQPLQSVKDQSVDDSRSEAPTGCEERESSTDCLVDSVAHDVFVRLGRHAAMVYAALSAGALSAKEVREVSGVGRATVFKYLKILVDSGLVTHDGDLYEQSGESLDKAAADMGVVGLAEIRKADVQRQREAWKTLAPVIQLAHYRRNREHLRRSMRTAA